MKKLFTLLLFSILISTSVNASINVENEQYYAKFKGQDITLNVYNWGEYISDGGEGSVDVIAEFENLTGINVTYTTYETNEDLYAKLSSS
ncbi:MAG: spermidine/putrescine ABC transporter substrate-binding protein, partial [Clostridia bacterium]|nr:spermidine/putrescine ABC transporter substrate-binding protein [Clostridia bacterium]